MGYSTVTDIVYNPEVIRKIMGQSWATRAKVWQSGILVSDSMPVEGLIQTTIMQKRFEGRSGQAAVAGATLSLANREQVAANKPVIYRYDGIEEPNLAAEVEKKGVDVVNASLAEGIAGAAAQFIDDSTIKTIEGTAEALAGTNAYDATTSVGTLEDIATAMQKLGDNSDSLRTGAIIMRSEKEIVFIKLGLVAATSNTFGNAAQDEMVRQGRLPQNIVGLTPIVTDKLAKEGGGDYYTYIVGRGAVEFGYNGAPEIDTQKKYGAHTTFATTFAVRFSIGAIGMNWTVAAKENVTDAELATNTSWTLKALSAKNVLIARLQNT